MSVTTIEGIVKDGKVVTPSPLPESAVVYVVIPEPTPPIRIYSPRLADPDDARLFVKTVEDDSEDEV